MEPITIFGHPVSPWLLIPVVYFVWVSIGLTVKKLVFDNLHRLAKRSSNQIDDLLVAASDFPLTLIIFASGGLLLENFVPNGEKSEMTKYLLVAFKAVTIVAIILFVDKLINKVIDRYSTKVDILKTSGSVVQTFARILVMVLGVLILLDSFGVSITPILASLGIGSLAVALALQPTLENFFAGIQMVIDQPIKAGQFIKLESGEEGYVENIGWRSTWVRQLANNIIVIPNKQIVNSRILNFYYPTKELAVLVEVGVHYQADLDHVERVTMEVGKETMQEVTGAVPEFLPFIRFHTFSDFSINFTVILRAKEFVDNYLIKHEFIKRLHRRYAQEGIVIPYPIRAINYDQERQFSSEDQSKNFK